MEDVTTTGAESTAAQTSTESAAASASSEPIALTNDSMVRLPGQDKPVKYGDWYRGFQSQYTKTAQAKAELQRELEGLRQQATQQRQQGQPTTPNKRQQMIQQLKAKTYLSGEEAAQVIDNMFGDVDETIHTRDQALRLIAQKVLQLDKQAQETNSERAQQSFSSKVTGALRANSLPDELKDFAEFIYMGHEGNDLDQEFPGLVKSYWEKFANVVRQMDQKKVAAARNIQLPGKGGQGSASKPLDTSRMSPKQQADALWGVVQGSEGT